MKDCINFGIYWKNLLSHSRPWPWSWVCGLGLGLGLLALALAVTPLALLTSLPTTHGIIHVPNSEIYGCLWSHLKRSTCTVSLPRALAAAELDYIYTQRVLDISGRGMGIRRHFVDSGISDSTLKKFTRLHEFWKLVFKCWLQWGRHWIWILYALVTAIAVKKLQFKTVYEASFTRYNLMSKGLSYRFDKRVNVCIHDKTGCQTGGQTGCQTGLTTGCIVYTNIQPVVKPVWQPVWQPAVSWQWLFVQHGCQTGLTTGLISGWMFVYTIQPGYKKDSGYIIQLKRSTS